MGYKNNSFLAFTLVELMVVIVIVSILAVVGFVSYTSYLTQVRDTKRIVSLTKAVEVFQSYSRKNKLPIPDDAITITASGVTVAYQGKLGEDVLEILNVSEKMVDPKDNEYYSYYLSSDRKGFQFLAFMEEDQKIGSFIPATYAADYSDRYLRIFGLSLGILLEESTNTPLEDLSIPGDTLTLESIGVDYNLNSYLTETQYVTNNTGALIALAELTPKKGKGWRVVNNEFQCFDVNDDGRCISINGPVDSPIEPPIDPPVDPPIDPPVDDSVCLASANTGDICGGWLVVDYPMMQAVSSAFHGGDQSFAITASGNTYTFEDSAFNIYTGYVTSLSHIFRETSFNGDIGYWDTSSVITMGSLFSDNTVFNQDIGEWDTSNVEGMNSVFFGASAFNQDIGEWDTSKNTRLENMFNGAAAFNQDISGWETGLATRTQDMFNGATNFNANISSWDMDSNTRAQRMFHDASNFNQNLSSWSVDLDGVTNCVDFDDGASSWVLAKPTFANCTP